MNKVKLDLKRLGDLMYDSYRLLYGGSIEKVNNTYMIYSAGGTTNGIVLAQDGEVCEIVTDGLLKTSNKKLFQLSDQEFRLFSIPVIEKEESINKTGYQSDLISRSALIQTMKEDDTFNYSDNLDFIIDNIQNAPGVDNTSAREEVIDEFAKRLHELCGMENGDCQYPDILHEERIDEVAKELKGSASQITQDMNEETVSVKVPKSLLESEGETVYYIMDSEICECTIGSIIVDTKGVWAALLSDEYIFPYRTPDAELDDDPQDWCEKSTLVSADEWGKSLFPTRERAEAQLETEEEAER